MSPDRTIVWPATAPSHDSVAEWNLAYRDERRTAAPDHELVSRGKQRRSRPADFGI
jgi:hypothetical protein